MNHTRDHTNASANGADWRRIVIGLGLLAFVALVVVAWPYIWQWLTGQGPTGEPTPTPAPTAPPPIALKGLACGSKADLLKNPEIKRILLERYRIGDIDCPATPSGDCGNAERLKDKDFIWPAGLYYVELCKKTLGHSLDYEVIYVTPIVFYSWNCVTDELIRRGQVMQNDGVYYIPDMQKFTKALIAGTPWEGACGVNGKMVVFPTNPAKSASGMEFAALILAMLNGGEVTDERTVESLLPTLTKYIASLGILEETSQKLFANCVKKGQGACPMFAVYESQGIDLVKAYPTDKTIVNNFRTIYPQPTTLADHEIIALNSKGKLFLDAMKDTEVQAILWRDHGFRTGPVMDPKVHEPMRVPAEITAVINSPSGPVQDRIKCYLDPKASGCPGVATPPPNK